MIYYFSLSIIQINAPLKNLVNKNVNIVFEDVKKIDTSERKIIIENNEISYDYLIIALGTELDKKYLDKNQNNIHDFYTYEGAQKLREELNKIQKDLTFHLNFNN